MGKRLLTSLIGIIVFFAVVLSNNFYILFGAVTILVIGMLYEMYSVMCVSRFLRFTGYVTALLVCVSFAKGRMFFALIAPLFIFTLAMIAMHGKVTSKKVLSVGFVTALIAAFMSTLFMMRRGYFLIIPFLCAWLTDTGAYTCGSLFGKHKLAETISPNKTIEGAVGGLVFSTLGSILFIYIMVAVSSKEPITWALVKLSGVIKFAILGFLTSVVSQIGDLSASCIKRDFEKKDYGKILPGHGGLLDRFDSVLLAIPFVYYAVKYLLFLNF